MQYSQANLIKKIESNETIIYQKYNDINDFFFSIQPLIINISRILGFYDQNKLNLYQKLIENPSQFKIFYIIEFFNFFM